MTDQTKRAEWGADPMPLEGMVYRLDPPDAFTVPGSMVGPALVLPDHDRIRQMAQEAGFSPHSFNAIDGDEVMAGEYVITDELARFAQLVAEDCARVADENDFGPIPHHIGDNLRARYSLKD